MIEPKLRFPEFNDSWNKYKIENIFDRVGVPVELTDSQTYREIGIRSHGKGIFHKEETTSTEIGNKRVFWVEPGCFVVNIVFAWERAVAKTTEKENGMIASHRFPMYRPKKDIVDLDYITEYFITKRGQNVLILASPGGAGRNKTLGQKEFAKSVVKLPSLPEQQKIAEFLSTVDTVVEKQKEIVSAWEERKKGVMQKLFSQEVRFKDDDGSEFPEWETKKLCEITKQYKVRNKNKLPLEIYSVNNIVGFVPQSEQFDDAGYLKDTNTSIYMIVPPKHFAYNPARLDIGSIGYQYLEHDVQVSSLYEVFETSELVNDKFLWSWFHTNYFRNVVKRLQEGGVRLYFYYDKMQEVKIELPSLLEQQKIADCLSSLDEVIEKQKETLAAWEELKKGLLQQMFV